MEMNDLRFEIGEASAVGEARRAAARLAANVGLGETDGGRLAIVVTEAATNLVAHGGGGELLLGAGVRDGRPAVDVVALDRGPGIADLPAALRDGFSSAGTVGNGLGGIARAASEFDIHSRADVGTAVFARIGPPARDGKRGMVVGAINVPHPAETISGDCWALRRRNGRVLLLVADGLGHGASANDAARAAERAFQRHADLSPAEILDHIHAALRSTRGAAAAVAEIDGGRRIVRFAGLGNIAGVILGGESVRNVVSHNGTAGHEARRIQEFTYPWPEGGLLVLHSDGLVSRWTFDAYPELQGRHPMLTAAVLYRDFRRGRDDTTVVVLREAA